MTFTEIPMVSPDKTSMSLLEVLKGLPGDDSQWRLYEFGGVGIPPAGYTMPSFEKYLLSLPYGHTMTWRELIDFASSVEETWNCFIVGTARGKKVSWEDLKHKKYADCIFVIEGVDSWYWNIGRKSRC